jgi:hypothetical protein
MLGAGGWRLAGKATCLVLLDYMICAVTSELFNGSVTWQVTAATTACQLDKSHMPGALHPVSLTLL